MRAVILQARTTTQAKKDSMTKLLVDTGPLVAYCNRRDAHHSWARNIAQHLLPPLYTCEPCLTEVFWRIQRHGGKVNLLWDWIRERVLVVDFAASRQWPDLERLMTRYADQKMDFADAWLVRMSELMRDCQVWTADHDF